MHKAALQLFLTECTALQLKEAVEASGGLSSALSKRHKIRKADLEYIFALADDERANSLARKYLVMLLLTYAGAAYKNYRMLWGAPKNSLRNVPVTPHWDMKAQSFGSIYLYEPMNLWPGFSHQNQRNNTETLDPHYVHVHRGGILTNDLEGDVQEIDETENFLMAESIFSEDGAQRKEWLHTSKVKVQSTPYTKSLLRGEDKIKLKMKKLHGKEKRTYDSEKIVKKFKKIEEMLKATTIAGEAHYTQLIDNMKKIGFDSDDDYIKELTRAKEMWTSERRSMLSDLSGITLLISRSSKMTLNHINKGP